MSLSGSVFEPSRGRGLKPCPKVKALTDEFRAMRQPWGAIQAVKFLTPERLDDIHTYFELLETPDKRTMLLAFFYAQPCHLARCSKTMQKVIDKARVDSDDWVRGLGDLLINFTTTGSAQTSQLDSESIFFCRKAANLDGEGLEVMLPEFAQRLGNIQRCSSWSERDLGEEPPYMRTEMPIESLFEDICKDALEAATSMGLDDDETRRIILEGPSTNPRMSQEAMLARNQTLLGLAPWQPQRMRQLQQQQQQQQQPSASTSTPAAADDLARLSKKARH
mmetsp:Transcript_39975/g.86270  ORF Transcript_39975/g.86270 Transcript_39975/m.86270 type:complete len:278 (-) Transcript_39975:291-1124(-)